MDIGRIFVVKVNDLLNLFYVYMFIVEGNIKYVGLFCGVEVFFYIQYKNMENGNYWFIVNEF